MDLFRCQWPCGLVFATGAQIKNEVIFAFHQLRQQSTALSFVECIVSWQMGTAGVGEQGNKRGGGIAQPLDCYTAPRGRALRDPSLPSSDQMQLLPAR